VEKISEALHDSCGCLGLQIALPKPEDPPTTTTQLRFNMKIPRAIARDFIVPVAPAGTRAAITTRAPVPETSMNENRDLIRFENEIGRTR